MFLWQIHLPSLYTFYIYKRHCHWLGRFHSTVIVRDRGPIPTHPQTGVSRKISQCIKINDKEAKREARSYLKREAAWPERSRNISYIENNKQWAVLQLSLFLPVTQTPLVKKKARGACQNTFNEAWGWEHGDMELFLRKLLWGIIHHRRKHEWNNVPGHFRG